MKFVSFGITSVQKGRRVSLDDSLLQNLNIKIGDQVEIFLDTEQEAIIVRKSQNAAPEAKAGRRKKQKTEGEQ